MIRITPSISIAELELEEHFIRAPGPGGQNVNKLASAVELRFDVRRSPSLPDDVRARLERLAGSRLTREGVLVIDAHRHRTQARNRQDARERLLDLVRRPAVTPVPRRATKPTAGARERRLESRNAAPPSKACGRKNPRSTSGFGYTTLGYGDVTRVERWRGIASPQKTGWTSAV